PASKVLVHLQYFSTLSVRWKDCGKMELLLYMWTRHPIGKSYRRALPDFAIFRCLQKFRYNFFQNPLAKALYASLREFHHHSAKYLSEKHPCRSGPGSTAR